MDHSLWHLHPSIDAIKCRRWPSEYIAKNLGKQSKHIRERKPEHTWTRSGLQQKPWAVDLRLYPLERLYMNMGQPEVQMWIVPSLASSIIVLKVILSVLGIEWERKKSSLDVLAVPKKCLYWAQIVCYAWVVEATTTFGKQWVEGGG
jgi:hypothetical protein